MCHHQILILGLAPEKVDLTCHSDRGNLTYCSSIPDFTLDCLVTLNSLGARIVLVVIFYSVGSDIFSNCISGTILVSRAIDVCGNTPLILSKIRSNVMLLTWSFFPNLYIYSS